jgi:hypothetical protein
MMLNPADIIHMLSLPAIKCPECGQPTCQNYCRQCDDYFRIGHLPKCTQFSEHAGHRIYPTLPITPFATYLCDWAIHLDVVRDRHVWIEHAAIKAMFGDRIGTPEYLETFMEMGDRALTWVEKATNELYEGKVYAMHFAGHELDLRIGIVGGQLMLFTPKAEVEDGIRVSQRR